MSKQPWEVPDPPPVGDATADITFRAVGAALSNWEWFEGNLSLTFSFLIGAGYGNVAASRAYGSVETFRGRATMIQRAAEVYFRHDADDQMQAGLEEVLNRALNQLSARRNEIAHGIVQPFYATEDFKSVHKGFVLYPPFYATRKRKLADMPPLTDITITPTYVYSSVEIDGFGRLFGELANKAIDTLTLLARREQTRATASMRR